MDIIFQGDIFKYVLCNYLGIHELLKLMKVFKYPSNMLKEFLNKKIETRLALVFKEDEEKIKQFKKLLEESKGVISGSFIMQCVLNEHWDSDIDIFIPRSFSNGDSIWWRQPYCSAQYHTKDDFFLPDGAKNLKVKYIKGLNPDCRCNGSGISPDWAISLAYRSINDSRCEYCVHDVSGLEAFLLNEGDFYNEEDYVHASPFYYKYLSPVTSYNFPQLDLSITSAKSFTVNGFHLQVLTCHRDILSNIDEFIEKTFDFSICKNTVTWNNDKIVLNIKNLESLIAKTFTYKHNGIFTTPQRREKYEKRGFTIIDL